MRPILAACLLAASPLTACSDVLLGVERSYELPDASFDTSQDAGVPGADASLNVAQDEEASDSGVQDAQWLSLGQLPVAATAMTAAVVGGQLYALGGGDHYYGDQLYRTQLRYSANTDSWTPVAGAVPDDGTWGCQAHEFGGRLYLVGGWGLPLPAFRVFDPDAGSWMTLEPPPVGADFGFVSAIIGQHLYVAGGDSAGEANAPAARYDLTGGGWSSISALPSNLPLGALSGTAVGGRLYVLNGGSDPGRSTLQVYDTASEQWTTGAPLTKRLRAAAAVAVGTEIYFIGGSDQHEPRQRNGNLASAIVYDDVHVYDTVADSWRQAPSLAAPRDYAAAVLFEGRIHVMGGSDGPGNGTPWHEAYAVE